MFTAIVTSHAFERGLRHMLGNLQYQTSPPDETIVLYSGYDPGVILRLREDFPWVDQWVERDDLQDAGHDKRAHGLGLASREFLGFFNDDDEYKPDYLEKMLGAAEMADAVFCRWHTGDIAFRLGSSTSGNFIVRTELAQAIGYPWRDYCADGHFINAIADGTEAVVHVPEDLYSWNAIKRGDS